MRFELGLEKPPLPQMAGLQRDFLENRRHEFIKINQFQANKNQSLELLHNWASYSEPYGFEILGKVAQEIISALKKEDSVLIDELTEVLADYFVKKRRSLAKARLR